MAQLITVFFSERFLSFPDGLQMKQSHMVFLDNVVCPQRFSALVTDPHFICSALPLSNGLYFPSLNYLRCKWGTCGACTGP